MANDLFRKYKSLYSSTTNSFGTGTSETITPATVVGLPTDTDITLTFDRQVTGKIERIIGTISGSNFVIKERGVDGTTEQAHTSPTVEMIWNAKDENDLVDGLLVGHTQTGAHKSQLVTDLKATGAVVNTGTSDVTIVTPKALADSNAVFTTKTQTLTNKTLTNPIINAATHTVTASSPSASATQDMDLDVSSLFKITMPAGPLTLTVSNETTGQFFVVEIVNATSQGTLTWFSTITWAGGSAPTLTGTNAKKDTFGFRVTGADTYDGYVIGQNV